MSLICAKSITTYHSYHRVFFPLFNPTRSIVYDAHSRNEIVLSSEYSLKKYAEEINSLIKPHSLHMLPLSVNEIVKATVADRAAMAIDNETKKVAAFMRMKVWWEFQDENHKPFVEICSAIVSPAYRNQGLAEFLFEKVLQQAQTTYAKHRIIAVVLNGQNTLIERILRKYGHQVPLESRFPDMKKNAIVYEFNNRPLA